MQTWRNVKNKNNALLDAYRAVIILEENKKNNRQYDKSLITYNDVYEVRFTFERYFGKIIDKIDYKHRDIIKLALSSLWKKEIDDNHETIRLIFD